MLADLLALAGERNNHQEETLETDRRDGLWQPKQVAPLFTLVGCAPRDKAAAAMKVPKIPTIVAAVVCAAFTYSQAQEAAVEEEAIAISATDTAALTANVGKQVIAEGVVVSAAKGPNDGARFLNFSDDTTGLSALIVPAVYPDLKPLEEYEGKTVRVTGKLDPYKDKTQIRVSRIAQIEVVEAPEPAAAD
jgi:DNA/RNA endonuclease YhcR with UshA esterase domain